MKYFNVDDRIVECVPNFSEGRDKSAIDEICAAIDAVPGAKLLHRDMGYDANRTVITFAATAESVVEAAFQGFRTASGLIDMRTQQGEHPRIGAVDVCPFIPLKNISMKDTVFLSRLLGQRVAEELNIPVYLYGASASLPKRANMAYLRKGEYEGMRDKLRDPLWIPDFGQPEFNPKSGVSAVGARDFLVAYNVNLDTQDVQVAHAIAQRIRESGYWQDGVRIPGKIKGVKAIGWNMKSYGCAQVSTNITDIYTAGIHTVFEAVKAEAGSFGCTVYGSELIGLIPTASFASTVEYYGSTVFHDSNKNNLINLIINHLGLNTSNVFVIDDRILERML